MKDIQNKKLYDFITRKLQMDQTEFASAITVTDSNVTYWLQNKGARPKAEVVRRIARRLGMSYGEIWELFK